MVWKAHFFPEKRVRAIKHYIRAQQPQIEVTHIHSMESQRQFLFKEEKKAITLLGISYKVLGIVLGFLSHCGLRIGREKKFKFYAKIFYLFNTKLAGEHVISLRGFLSNGHIGFTFR